MRRQRHVSVAAEAMNLSRRRFVQGLAAGGTLASFSLLSLPAWARTGLSESTTPRQVLSGTEFDLVIGEVPANFTGKTGVATAVNGQIPAPELRWREGDIVTLRVTNQLQHPTSIHWHGIILPIESAWPNLIPAACSKIDRRLPAIVFF